MRQSYNIDGSLMTMKKAVVLKCVISLILFFYLFWTISFGELLDLISNADHCMLFLTILISVPVGYLISTIKWQVLLRAHGINNISLQKLWAFYFMGSFFSNFLPTEIGGDVMRGYEVGKISENKIESYASIFMERFTGFASMILLAFFGLFFNRDIVAKMNLTFVIMSSFFCFSIITFLITQKGTARIIKKTINFKSMERIVNKIQSFYLSLLYYKNKPLVILKTMIISFVFQMVPIFYVYFIYLSLGIEVPIMRLILFVPTISLLGIIPITINGLGLREGAFVFMFSYLNIAPPDSLAASLIFRLGILFMSSIGGILYIYMHVTKLKDIKADQNS